MEQGKKWGGREEDKWGMEGEWMREDTHSDTERWKTCLRETFSHHQAGRQLARSQPPLNSEDLLVVAPPKPPHYHIFYHSIFPKARHDNQREGGERGMDRKGKTPLIYMPLRNWNCISLSCAIVYCVWLSNGKNGTEKGWAGCWAIKAALCVVACQNWWLPALTNLVT